MPSPKELACLKIPLEDIVKATNNFCDENLIRVGGFGEVYKGKILWLGEWINIVARRLHYHYGQGKIEFWTEVTMLASLKHKNLVSIVGFCDENDEKIIVNKYENHQSLDKYLSDSNQLSWLQRLQICVGVAHALSYIHYDVGRDFSVIHRNIKSSKVLLDEKFEPKLSGFELSLKNTRARRHRLLLTKLSGTIGYVDPVYEKTRSVTDKSDVYSFGVVLFEVLCGRRAYIQDRQNEWLFPVKEISNNPFLDKQVVNNPPINSSSSSFNYVPAETRQPFSSNNLPSRQMKSLSAELKPSSFNNKSAKSHKGFRVVNTWNSPKNSIPKSFGSLGDSAKVQAASPFTRFATSNSSNSKDRCFSVQPLFTMKTLEHLHIPNEGLLAQLAKSHYEAKKLRDMIDPNLWNQMDQESFNVFSKTAFYCIKEQRAERPNIDQIAKLLEKALELQRKHEQSIIDGASSNLRKEHSIVDGASSNLRKVANVKHLKIGLDVIKAATEDFSETYCIGSGGYGTVYKAQIEHYDSKISLAVDGKDKSELPKKCSDVALKLITRRGDAQGEEGFYVEIETLTRCNHPNVISLVGFCDEGPEMILVYEHASNGSLSDYLENNGNVTDLTWAQRIKICLGIARGLNYLHTNMEDKERIIHCDIKSANILLDGNWEAKIADFGLSKFQPKNHEGSTLNAETIVGTKVYLDPEYEKTGKLKRASDIYSFGVVLFEILCGRLAYDPIYIKNNESGLASIARKRYNMGTLKEMVDPKLKEENEEIIFTLNKGPNQDSLDAFFKIAYKCVAETQANRPTIEVIIMELEKALYFQITKYHCVG